MYSTLNSLLTKILFLRYLLLKKNLICIMYLYYVSSLKSINLYNQLYGPFNEVKHMSLPLTISLSLRPFLCRYVFKKQLLSHRSRLSLLVACWG